MANCGNGEAMDSVRDNVNSFVGGGGGGGGGGGRPVFSPRPITSVSPPDFGNPYACTPLVTLNCVWSHGPCGPRYAVFPVLNPGPMQRNPVPMPREVEQGMPSRMLVSSPVMPSSSIGPATDHINAGFRSAVEYQPWTQSSVRSNQHSPSSCAVPNPRTHFPPGLNMGGVDRIGMNSEKQVHTTDEWVRRPNGACSIDQMEIMRRFQDKSQGFNEENSKEPASGCQNRVNSTPESYQPTQKTVRMRGSLKNCTGYGGSVWFPGTAIESGRTVINNLPQPLHTQQNNVQCGNRSAMVEMPRAKMGSTESRPEASNLEKRALLEEPRHVKPMLITPKLEPGTELPNSTMSSCPARSVSGRVTNTSPDADVARHYSNQSSVLRHSEISPSSNISGNRSQLPTQKLDGEAPQLLTPKAEPQRGSVALNNALAKTLESTNNQQYPVMCNSDQTQHPVQKASKAGQTPSANEGSRLQSEMGSGKVPAPPVFANTNVEELLTAKEERMDVDELIGSCASIPHYPILRNLFPISTDFEGRTFFPNTGEDAGTRPGFYPNQVIYQSHSNTALTLAPNLSNDLALVEEAPSSSEDSLPGQMVTNMKKRKCAGSGTTVFRVSAENADICTIDDEKNIRKALLKFDALRRHLLAMEQSSRSSVGMRIRPDLKAASLMLEKGMWVNRGSKFIGPVPGIRVGYHSYFRIELCLIGLHGQIQAGIDYISSKYSGLNEPIAISIIASGGYEDEDAGEVLIYTGQGGNNYIQDKKEAVDQKLDRGNLGLERSMHHGFEIRVIRGVKDTKSPSGKIYVYDGLYKIENSWVDRGRGGCWVFKYKLRRLAGQSELASDKLKKSRLWKDDPWSRADLLHTDLSCRSECLPIRLSNSVDGNQQIPSFVYVTRIVYPSSTQDSTPEGCQCSGGCQSNSNCICMQSNGPQNPYTSNGCLVKWKPLIYECGDQCSCSVTCRNRVTQQGLKTQLEVFRTSDSAWGVMSWDPIPAGTFLCEYVGEIVVVEGQAAQTALSTSEKYVLDVQKAQKRCSEWGDVSDILNFEAQINANFASTLPPLNFLIDARQRGNVSRFINHSECPNVIMQFVVHGKLDCKLPHVMLFAGENIPAQTELLLDYGHNPAVDDK